MSIELGTVQTDLHPHTRRLMDCCSNLQVCSRRIYIYIKLAEVPGVARKTLIQLTKKFRILKKKLNFV